MFGRGGRVFDRGNSLYSLYATLMKVEGTLVAEQAGFRRLIRERAFKYNLGGGEGVAEKSESNPCRQPRV